MTRRNSNPWSCCTVRVLDYSLAALDSERGVRIKYASSASACFVRIIIDAHTADCARTVNLEIALITRQTPRNEFLRDEHRISLLLFC
jgi:hypothetical protein